MRQLSGHSPEHFEQSIRNRFLHLDIKCDFLLLLKYEHEALIPVLTNF